MKFKTVFFRIAIALFLAQILSPMIALKLCGKERRFQWELGLGTGVDATANRDKLASPLKYSGIGFPLQLTIRINAPKYSHHLEMFLISTTLTNAYKMKSSQNTALISWHKARVAYKYLRVIELNSRFLPRIHVGGGINQLFFLREYDIMSGVSWEYSCSFDASCLFETSLTGKRPLFIGMDISLLGFIHSPESFYWDEEFQIDFHTGKSLLKYGRVMGGSRFFKGNLFLRYPFKISDRSTLQAETGIRYYQIKRPDIVKNLDRYCRLAFLYRL